MSVMDRSERRRIRQWTHDRLGGVMPHEDEPLDWNLKMLDSIDELEDRIAQICEAYVELGEEERPERSLERQILKAMNAGQWGRA